MTPQLSLFNFAPSAPATSRQAVTDPIPPKVSRAARILRGERRRTKSGTVDAARTARDRALSRVTENNSTWLDDALAVLASLTIERMTGEEIRLQVQAAMGGIGPSHHNAWGALVMVAKRRGLLVPTGEWEQMRTAKSHARMTPVYRRGRGAC